MSNPSVLKTLEELLESFLDRAVAIKEERLAVLEGINRLDDIARASASGADVTDEITEWFTDRSNWLTEKRLRPADFNRIDGILKEVSKTIEGTGKYSPSREKISSAIGRWRKTSESVHRSVTLKRGPEIEREPVENSITLFSKTLTRISNLFMDLSDSKKHLLSVLDDSLDSAQAQKNRDALLLSAFIIYYLKQGNYKVDPYVKRLKEAERLFKGG